jgi:hypothetical protein
LKICWLKFIRKIPGFVKKSKFLEFAMERDQDSDTGKKYEEMAIQIGKVIGYTFGYILVSRLLVNWAARKITKDADSGVTWDIFNYFSKGA